MAPPTRWNPDGKDGVVFDTSHPDVALVLLQWLMAWFTFAVTFYALKFIWVGITALKIHWLGGFMPSLAVIWWALKCSGAFPDPDHNRPLRTWLWARCYHCKRVGFSWFYTRGHVGGSRWFHTRCHHEIQRQAAEQRLVRSINEPL